MQMGQNILISCQSPVYTLLHPPTLHKSWRMFSLKEVHSFQKHSLYRGLRSNLVTRYIKVMTIYCYTTASEITDNSRENHTPEVIELMTIRVAEVARAREQRSPKGQGLLRKEGAPTYAILSPRNLVLSQFTRFLKGFHRAFNESHPAFVAFSKKAFLLS